MRENSNRKVKNQDRWEREVESWGGGGAVDNCVSDRGGERVKR